MRPIERVPGHCGWHCRRIRAPRLEPGFTAQLFAPAFEECCTIRLTMIPTTSGVTILPVTDPEEDRDERLDDEPQPPRPRAPRAGVGL